MPRRPRVVIVGAGFGGLSAARAMARMPVDVTVVDRQNHHGFWPLLYEVATAGLSVDDIAYSVRGILRGQVNVNVEMATVESVDLEKRRVHMGPVGHLDYDYLVLAAGTCAADFGVPGVARHAFTLKTLADAQRLRDHVLGQFERTHADPGLVDAGALTVVIAGGGPSGVELAGAFVELFDLVLARDYPGPWVRRAQVVLVETADHLLHGFSHRSQEEALRTLAGRGVDIRLGRSVTAVGPDGVSLDDGSFVAAGTTVWVAGVRASPLADSLGVAQSRSGTLVVGADLSLPEHPEVFAIGDFAGATDGSGQPYAQVAQVAIQGGRHTARSIARRIDGRPTQPFHYKDKGIMATVGRRSAVAELPFGFRLGGTLGWVSWLALHLVYLIGFRNRLAVLLSWGWNYVTWDRSNRVIVATEEVGRSGDGSNVGP